MHIAARGSLQQEIVEVIRHGDSDPLRIPRAALPRRHLRRHLRRGRRRRCRGRRRRRARGLRAAVPVPLRALRLRARPRRPLSGTHARLSPRRARSENVGRVAPPGAGVGRGREGCELRTILVVEDEPKILRIVCDYLDRAGFRSVEAVDGRSALQLAQRDRPDLVVLDLGLPDMDGLDVIRRLRERSRVPVVVLTARGEESDRLVGLELGADDYVVKPFSPKEVVARVRAVLRRTERAAEPGRVVRAGDVTVDLDRMSVTAGERAVELTRTEIQLLATLARQPGRVFTRAQLLDAIHGVEVDSYERAIDAHVKNIRRKLESDPRRPRYLLTVHAVGYRFAES